jgi:hypothetical protein
MPSWMDQYTYSVRILGSVMISITRQNEIPTELKAISLMGSEDHMSSHPSKIINWHMRRRTLMLNYKELRL